MSELALLGGKKTRTRPFPAYPVMTENEIRAAADVVKSSCLSGFIAGAGDNFLGGPEVIRLEESIKKYFDTGYAVSVNSGTAALHSAFKALGISEGDEVIVPPYTMCATASAVVMAGGTPVFCDIDKESFCISPVEIEKAITPKTRAICVVHLFGNPADMTGIIDLAVNHRLKVVEDCAQAPGATYQGKYVGTFGDIGVFSFNQHKTVTSGEGGFAVTDDKDLARRMRLVRNHGEAVVEGMGLEESCSDIIGYNYRMTEIEAAIALSQFSKLDELNSHRIRLAEYLTDKLSSIRGLELPRTDKSNKGVYFLLPVILNEDFGITRDRLADALIAEGIPFGKGYVKPLYLQPFFQKSGKSESYRKGSCPVTEKMHFESLINSSPAIFRDPMSEADMDDVVKAFRKIILSKEELNKETVTK